MDIDASISCRSVGCIGKIALKFPFVINLCTETLMSLLALEKDYITSQILEVIRGILTVFVILLGDLATIVQTKENVI